MLTLLGVVSLTITACSSLDAPREESAPASGSTSTNQPLVSTPEVLAAVAAAQSLTALPDTVVSSLTKNDQVYARNKFECQDVKNPANAEAFGECAYGDRNGSKLMVIYGDSRADMWAATLEGIAARNGYKLRIFAKHACGGADLPFISSQTKTVDQECATYHTVAPQAIRALNPDLVVASSLTSWRIGDDVLPTEEEFHDGWSRTLRALSGTNTKLAILGDFQIWDNDNARCLAAHVTNVQQCSNQPYKLTFAEEEKGVAQEAGALYIPTSQWICAEKCEPVIAEKRVFNDTSHFTQTYAVYLTGALQDALKPIL